MDAEIQWIKSLQLPSGAILLSSQRESIQPYFDHLAVWAVLKTRPQETPFAKKWLDWVFANLNRPGSSGVPGTVYDFMVDHEHEMNLYTCDSFDAYNGTFLMLLGEYWKITHDRAYFQSKLPDIKLILHATLQSKNEHGLTNARPDAQIAYLMDNVEVWRGLTDIALVFADLGQNELAHSTRNNAQELQKTIEKYLWSPQLQSYLPYESELNPNPTEFYPFGTALIWPILFELPEAQARKVSLWNHFQAHWLSRWKKGDSDFFAWSLLAYTAAKSGDRNLAQEWELHATDMIQQRNWPWHVGESAGYLLYLNELK